MQKQLISPATVHKAQGYAHAIKVGNTVYIAGQAAIDQNNNVVGIGDFATQAHQTFKNLKMVLGAAGANVKDLVESTAYFRNIKDLSTYVEVRREYLGDHLVAGTAVEIMNLALPEMLIEVEAIAVID